MSLQLHLSKLNAIKIMLLTQNSNSIHKQISVYSAAPPKVKHHILLKKEDILHLHQKLINSVADWNNSQWNFCFHFVSTCVFSIVYMKMVF